MPRTKNFTAYSSGDWVVAPSPVQSLYSDKTIKGGERLQTDIISFDDAKRRFVVVFKNDTRGIFLADRFYKAPLIPPTPKPRY